MAERVLFVDDEPNILSAFRRQIRSYTKAEIETNSSALQALEWIATKGPYSVVVSDMMMPEMTGIEFLGKVKEIAPNTVRIMLTGHAERSVAIQAINEGSIFRFLSKPCSSELLTKALNDGFEQYRLICAEKELLSKTLSGSIKVLTDILQILDPIGFGQVLSVRDDLKAVCSAAGLKSSWDVELAAMLAGIGQVVIPNKVALKIRAHEELNAEERHIVERVPEVGYELLRNIPRLDKVAEYVKFQKQDFSKHPNIPLGASILRIVMEFNELQVKGYTITAALEQIEAWSGRYDSRAFKALKEYYQAKLAEGDELDEVIQGLEPVALELGELRPGMIVTDKVETKDGVLLISEGAALTDTLIERISNYSKMVGLKGPILIDPTSRE